MLMVFALTYAGCASLCLAMSRHYQQLLPKRKPSPQVLLALRLLGWCLLASALVYCVALQGIAVALVSICGLLMAAAAILALLVAYRPGLAIFLAIATPVLSLVG